MHEFALADAVVTTALEVAERERLTRISRVEVRIGELQRIKTDVFEFALAEVLPKTEPRLADAHFVLQVDPARFVCRACGGSFGLAELDSPLDADSAESVHFIPELVHAFASCPACGSPDFELSGGRGVSIAAIEGE